MSSNPDTVKVKSYRDLLAWQKAMDLVEAIYTITRSFPNEEIYALSSQMRRAAVSIPSNIAEGQSRRSSKEFLHHLSISNGSLSELETQILIAERLAYLSAENSAFLLDQTAEIGRLTNGLYRSIKDRTTDH